MEQAKRHGAAWLKTYTKMINSKLLAIAEADANERGYRFSAAKCVVVAPEAQTLWSSFGQEGCVYVFGCGGPELINKNLAYYMCKKTRPFDLFGRLNDLVKTIYS